MSARLGRIRRGVAGGIAYLRNLPFAVTRFERISHRHAAVYARIVFWVKRDCSVSNIVFKRYVRCRDIHAFEIEA